jgi:PAS domain S-box-containing protein
LAAEDGRITSWNQSAEAMFGYPAGEAVGAPVHLLVPPEGLPPPEDTTGVFSTAMREGRAEIESLRRHKDGRLIDVAVSAARMTDRSGRVLGVSAIFRDITRRKHADAELRDQLHLNRTITEHVAEALFMMDAEGRVTFSNPAAERLFGWTGVELRGQVLHDLMHHHRLDGRPYLAHECPLVGALRTGDVLRDHEDVFFGKDGSAIPVVCSNAPIWSGEQVVGAVLAAHDISERKKAEARQHLLVRELHHRVKNTLATVQAIAGSTMRAAGSMEEFQKAFTDRLISLGKTHTLITENTWEGAQLHDLLRLELDPYDDGSRGRVRLNGARIDLPADIAVAFGMAVHELTTNAVKHGSLSVHDGFVEITWTAEPAGDGTRLSLTWVERDGPQVTPPTRRGFGSQLLQRVFVSQVEGSVDMKFEPAGLEVTIIATLKGGVPSRYRLSS